MFRINLITTIRHLLKNRGLSVINIFGLSISVAVCVLAYVFVRTEFSYDNFHKKADNIFRLTNHIKPKERQNWYNTLHPHELAKQIKDDIPEVVNSTAMLVSASWVEYNQKQFRQRVAFGDRSFFEMFDFKFITGTPDIGENSINNIVITRKYADKLVKAGKYEELMGQSLKLLNSPGNLFTIVGIIEDIPKNSTIKFDIILGFEYQKGFGESNNDFGNSFIYLELNNEKESAKVANILTKNLKKYYGELYGHYVKNGYISDDINNTAFHLQPFRDIYLSEDTRYSAYTKKGDKDQSYIIITISVLVLILACINYIMLSVGVAMKRFKEIAVKKVFGCKRKWILNQFVVECGFTVLVSILIGLLLSELLLPVFNSFTMQSLELNILSDYLAILFLISLFVVIVLVISIPGVYISKQNPVLIFRNQTKMGSKLRIAKSFMIVQFTLSLILIISSAFIVKQTNYMRNKDVGFNTDQVVVMTIPFDMPRSDMKRMRDRIKRLPSVLNIAGSDRNFVWGSSTTNVEDKKGKERQVRMIKVEPEYFETLGINILQGRNFILNEKNPNLPEVVINEKFAKVMGMSQPLDEAITLWRKDVKIVGVVKDFHFDSMRDNIEPLAFITWRGFNKIRYYFIKLKANKISESLSSIESVWRDFDSKRDFKFSFLDENLDEQYKNEEIGAKVIGSMSAIALLISSLGLLGLTMLLLAQKFKEIGVRKVNGASTKQILLMINREFTKYLLVACFISIPVTYFGLSVWLEQFAYKTPLSIWLFILCSIVLYSVVLVTVSYKSLKAARQNPVYVLRYE